MQRNRANRGSREKVPRTRAHVSNCILRPVSLPAFGLLETPLYPHDKHSSASVFKPVRLLSGPDEVNSSTLQTLPGYYTIYKLSPLFNSEVANWKIKCLAPLIPNSVKFLQTKWAEILRAEYLIETGASLFQALVFRTLYIQMQSRCIS